MCLFVFWFAFCVAVSFNLVECWLFGHGFVKPKLVHVAAPLKK